MSDGADIFRMPVLTLSVSSARTRWNAWLLAVLHHFLEHRWHRESRNDRRASRLASSRARAGWSDSAGAGHRVAVKVGAFPRDSAPKMIRRWSRVERSRKPLLTSRGDFDSGLRGQPLMSAGGKERGADYSVRAPFLGGFSASGYSEHLTSQLVNPGLLGADVRRTI
jgi:hypothetical protein